VERPQLREGPDVLKHKALAAGVFDSDPDYMIKVKELGKVYSDGVAAVVNNTFAVKKGEVLGLLGPNGAGKSTTFNITTMDL
jgi:ABC-type uncharacterized transport system ATPase subunit